MARLDHGFVDIELGGETSVLKPTLGAMQAINRKFGNLRAAIEQVESLDFDAVVFILGAATGRKDVPEAVFETGIVNLIAPTATYLVNLMNPSGREPREGDGEGKA